jgi:pimeloyl-ACP methyl ester carboxylesterase
MHGLFGSSRNWQGHSRKLETGARIHLLDLRNHGASPWAERMDYPRMAADLLAYLDAARIGRALVVGHSMGGKVAMQFAFDHAERVERLIVADIAPVAYDRTYDDFIRAMQTSPLDGDRKAVDEHLARTVRDSAIRAFLMQNLVRGDDGLAWRINLEGIHAAMPAIMAAPEVQPGARFEGRTMFLRGDRSDYVLAEHKELISDLFPNSRTVSLKNAGHWLHAEQPDAFIRSMQVFFGLET